MFIWDGFLAGLGSVLSFGWPKKEPYPVPPMHRVVEDDWQRVSKDISLAIKKYKTEEKNGGA